MTTVIVAVPAVARSAALTAAVNVVAFVYVVTNAVLFHITAESLRKFVPLRVIVVAGLPAVAEDGLTEARVGVGLVGAGLLGCVPPLDPPFAPLPVPVDPEPQPIRPSVPRPRKITKQRNEPLGRIVAAV